MWEEGGGGGGGGGGTGGASGIATAAGGRGGKEAKEAYLVQFPREEVEDGGEMVDDEDGEGSLSGEGEENGNIKEEVRETGFLRGGGGGESGAASPCCSAASCRLSRNVDREIMRVMRVSLASFFHQQITAEMLTIKATLLIRFLAPTVPS